MGDQPDDAGDAAEGATGDHEATSPDGAGAPAHRTMSIGAGIGVGVGLFFLSCVAAFIVVAAMLGSSGLGPTYALIGVFLVVPVIAVVMLFFPRLRRGGTGILIVFAAGWLVVVGPCIAPSLMAPPLL